MTSDETGARLRELQRILAQSRTSSTSGEEDAAALHLAAMPVERIQRFTHTLASQPAQAGWDDVDGVTMRLLLDDYVDAVGHLRAVSRLAAARIDAAVGPIYECRSFLARQDKLALKRAAVAQEP